MNKGTLIEEVQKELCSSKADAERALDAVINAIKKGIVEEGNVQLIGFGTFAVSTRAARDGINPKTKEKIRIAASKTIKYRPSSNLKDTLAD